ncbi:MAG: hypothetical protein C5B55_05290 [Blastocatellia bacterium]|nr:MAG: hypothetical protein C5B55_05290 [Blastocatellia bacterium]
MPQELIQLNSRRTVTRVFLILTIGLAVFWCYFVLQWYLGNTMAEYFDTAENSVDKAKLASSLAPNDPLTHWRLGTVYQQKLTPDQSALIVAEYEKAVSLSPNDYRFWMSLGIALEQAGDVGRGERALRKSVELAPSYAWPRWYLGNLLLRSGRYNEAFSDLQFAAQSDSELKPQLFRLAIEIYGNDIAALKVAIGDDPTAKSEFALYLLQQNRVEDGLVIWNSLSDSQKKDQQTGANALITSLIGLNRFHDAMKIWNSVAPSDAFKADLGHVVDGGFEETISHSKDTPFGWQVNAAPQMQIGIDPQKAHNGMRSLRLVFQVRARLDFLDAYELVPVAPSTQYEFECYVRTEKLQSGDTPFVQILNASDQSVLASSSEAPNGDSDWNRTSVSFKTGDKTEAIKIHLARTPCEKDKICPIFGAVWYDDFSIKRQ